MDQKVRDVMTPGAITCEVGDTAADAAHMMKDHSIGDVIVLDGGQVVGLVTDRDLVVRVIADDLEPQKTRIGDICSRDVVSVSMDDDADHAVELMIQHAIRRIPVVETGTAVGMVTMGDLAVERNEHSALAAVSAAPPSN
jgi:CBS domain-containing protein